MQIMNQKEEAQKCLLELSTSIEHDAISWKHWWLVDLHPAPEDPEMLDESFSKEVQTLTAKVLEKIEGTMLVLERGRILVMCKNLETENIRTLIHKLQEETSIEVPPYTVTAHPVGTYHMSITRLIAEHVAQLPAAPSEEECLYALVEEGVRHHDILSDNELRVRRARQPSYILLVDDDPVTRRLVSALLGRQYRLITAENVQQAVEYYMVYTPDIVFMDINMPDHDGFSGLAAIQECDADACVVMFSSNSQMETMLKASRMGAKGFVCKPFRKEQLMHYITHMEQNKAQANGT